MDKNAKAVAIFDKLAETYQQKYMDISLYHDSLDIFISGIDVTHAEILELACGPGNITRYLLNERPDLKILATDLAPNMIRLGKANNPEADFEIMDCRQIGSLKTKFNGVMCGFCLPYLSKEEAIQLISDASSLLLPGGLLYLSTMEDDYSQSGIKKSSGGDEIFMHFHEAGYLLAGISDNGLKLKHISRKNYPASDGLVTTDLIIIAMK